MKILKCVPQCCFVIPEGTYRAKLVDMREYQKTDKGKRVEMIRMTFEIMSDSGEYQYKAGKSYVADLNNGSELKSDLETWEILSPNERCLFDPETLLGKEADICIQHYHNDAYAQPYCCIKGIYPAGRISGSTQSQEMAA
jgi:hypothetical protein